MKLTCQNIAYSDLQVLAQNHRHSIIVAGISGSGKTHLAHRYARFLGISDFYIINPAVNDLRTFIEECQTKANNIVVCIENLDSGVVSASYTLLKLIEECPEHIYVVITCNNLQGIPETIHSRCAIVNILPPTRADLDAYAKSKDLTAFNYLSGYPIWRCIRTFSEVEEVLKYTPEHLQYFDKLPEVLRSNDSVSSISWKFTHFADKAEIPVALVVRYISQLVSDTYHQRACIDCLNDLADNKISKNAIISKLVFELKYIG